MRIAPTGWPYILGGLGVAAAVFGVTRSKALAAVPFAFALFSLYFFRDPERETPADPEAAHSPADGVVMSTQVEGAGPDVTLRIFLSPLDVHVQRAPVDGRVTKVEYRPGRFHVASAEESRENERNVIGFEYAGQLMTLEQVAGFVARRIKCYVSEGETFEQGRRIGIIHFGSQVSLTLPPPWTFDVQPGQRVVGGVTVVARRVAVKAGAASAEKRSAGETGSGR